MKGLQLTITQTRKYLRNYCISSLEIMLLFTVLETLKHL